MIYSEILQKYKWVIVLALITALVYGLSNIIISGFAYMQPKVTFIQNTITKNSTQDRTMTTRRESTKPDGSREVLEEIRTAIDSVNFKIDESSSVKEPVSLNSLGQFAYGLGYAPLSREVGVKLSYWLAPSLAIELSHPVFSFGDSVQLPGLAPVIWASWRP